MTDRWRALLRVLLFVVAVVAIVGIFGAGVRMMLGRSSAPAVEAGPTPTAGVVGEPAAPKSLTNTLLGIYLYFRQSDIEQPVNPSDQRKIPFSIKPGETAATIGPRLEQAGLISDAGLFGWLVRYRGVDNALEVGDYQLSPSMSMNQIITELQHGRAKGVVVTIPEGWRMEQVAAKLEEAGLGTAEEYLALMSKHDYPYTWLKDEPRPEGAPDGLEGFLFPDTYQFSADATPAAVIDIMLRNFDSKVTPELRKAMASHGLTFYEALALAAIVEREAVVAPERPTIAGVFLNRLDRGMYLQADPTVSYAKGFDPRTKRWWMPMLVGESETVDSPYNTFAHGGVTPGPICSPGLASIEAVARPEATAYLYFVSKGDGSHVFAESFEEHLANVQKYGQR